MATIHAYIRQTHEDVDGSNTVHYGPSTNNKVIITFSWNLQILFVNGQLK